MNKLFSISVILFLSLCLTGCSYSVSFIIENHSNENISIKYQTKNLKYGDLTPRVMNLSQIGKKRIWEKLSEANYKIDEEKGIVEVNILPNQAFELTNTDPYWIKQDPYGEHFNIKSLDISGQNGAIQVEGNQVFEIVEPQKTRWKIFGPDVNSYILRYKETQKTE